MSPRLGLAALAYLAVASALVAACGSSGRAGSAVDGGGIPDVFAGSDVSTASNDSGGGVTDSGPSDAGEDSSDGAAACGTPGQLGVGDGGPFSYGKHYPNGVAAVDYIYGDSGMWGALQGLQYTYNYYSQCGTSDHPQNLGALVAAADGPPFTTRDANCHLLWAASPGATDPELGVPDGGAGSAFHEHSGVGANGVKTGDPFTVYWYDDNTLAINMSRAYGEPTASGLVTFDDFTRWAVISGNAAAWYGMPYGSAGNPTSDCCIDTHALNGLYDLAGGDFAGAESEWNGLLAMTGSEYDAATQRYLYPSIDSNYYFGLFKILTEELRANPSTTSSTDPSASLLLQHAMALDSDILDDQQEQGDSGTLIGWVTNVPAGGSLINTETIASEVLGLGARANTVFEPAVAPLSYDANGYFPRPYHALSAVASAGSQPGYMTKGPGFRAPVGTYDVDFRLRAPQPSGTIATVSIYDDVSGATLASQDVTASQMATGDVWTEVTVSVTVASACNSLELRTFWPGGGNLDVGPIRVR